MKKSVKRISYLGGLMLALCLNFNAFAAGWEYKSDISVDRIDGRLYLVTHCEDKIGDDCNMPGSASRIDISALFKIPGLKKVR